MNPDIVFEDNDILVCVKPAGIATQTRQVKSADMESILKNYLAGSRRGQPPYLGVIHRLDQPVEGLLVFAKTPFAAKELNRQLMTDGFGKYYRALLEGVPEKAEDTLTHYLCKDSRTNQSRICDSSIPGAKFARLSYRILRVIPGASPRSVAEIHLDTGRHHQIRVQMASIGCPIVGDTKYGVPDPAAKHQTGRSGIQLFACRLAFRHPRTKKTMEFELHRLD